MAAAEEGHRDLLTRVAATVERQSPRKGVVADFLSWLSLAMYFGLAVELLRSEDLNVAVLVLVVATAIGVYSRVLRMSELRSPSTESAHDLLILYREVEEAKFEAAKAQFEAAQARAAYLRKLGELEAGSVPPSV